MGNTVVHGVVWGGLAGGAAQGVRDLADGFVSRGHTVRTVAEGFVVGGAAGGFVNLLREALSDDDYDSDEVEL